MSTLTKEWLLKTIAELEEERDATPGAVNEDAAMALAAMKRALASLEAEPVAFRSKLKPPSAIGSEHWDYTDHRQPDAFELESCVIERLFTEPPALVAVPAGYRLQPISEYDAMCSAMLQGAKQTNYRAIVERIAEIIHGKVTDIDLLTVTVKSMKDKLQK
ncbi:Uncharacterised protein [Enterobacter hormaechei]|uniref:hypothetical protein n=1 Tax=Enterobacter hormaechei TaxID=158836 RepID=UPI000E0184BA|nr:hypothetical protein [Enterobacter hormaechei]MDK1417836.1 hypothetical protein [Enterobacter hormaechei]STP78149.1 Uncharacterised protein [Enterobacter hormaechei]